MIPETRESTMLVTMTQGQLAEVIRQAVTEAVGDALDAVEERHTEEEREKEVLVGAVAIGQLLHMSAKTVYSYFYAGVFGDRVQMINRRLYARRKDLLEGLKEMNGRRVKE